MKSLTFNKNIFLSALLIIIIGLILNRIIPPHVDAVFSMVISKNRVGITNIHQVRDIEATKTVMIDRINLTEKSRFRHPKLGEIGYANDFFVDVEANFTVKVAGDYLFFLGSDDGFIFSVDDKQLCEFALDRPLTTDTCKVNLSQGKHKFKLNYFNGYGNSGLVMAYANSSSGKQYLAGENSKYISFDD